MMDAVLDVFTLELYPVVLEEEDEEGDIGSIGNIGNIGNTGTQSNQKAETAVTAEAVADCYTNLMIFLFLSNFS